MKYFILGVVVSFILYWLTTGTLRRLFLPPQKKGRRQRRDIDRDRDVSSPPPSPPRRIDYGNIKDADYRDID